MSIPKVLGTIFFRTITVAALELCFSIRKNFKKIKLVEREKEKVDLISFFHVQIQEPTRSSTNTRAFAFPAKFYYHKIVEIRGR